MTPREKWAIANAPYREWLAAGETHEQRRQNEKLKAKPSAFFDAMEHFDTLLDDELVGPRIELETESGYRSQHRIVERIDASTRRVHGVLDMDHNSYAVHFSDGTTGPWEGSAWPVAQTKTAEPIDMPNPLKSGATGMDKSEIIAKLRDLQQALGEQVKATKALRDDMDAEFEGVVEALTERIGAIEHRRSEFVVGGDFERFADATNQTLARHDRVLTEIEQLRSRPAKLAYSTDDGAPDPPNLGVPRTPTDRVALNKDMEGAISALTDRIGGAVEHAKEARNCTYDTNAAITNLRSRLIDVERGVTAAVSDVLNDRLRIRQRGATRWAFAWGVIAGGTCGVLLTAFFGFL